MDSCGSYHTPCTNPATAYLCSRGFVSKNKALKCPRRPSVGPGLPTNENSASVPRPKHRQNDPNKKIL
jgi:hypothetical protein